MSLHPKQLPSITLGDRNIRFFVIRNGRVIIPKSIKCVNDGMTLFLGTDLFDYAENNHQQKNGHRIHARHSKEGVATKLSLMDFRVDGINNSNVLWAYTVQGLFQFIFTTNNRQIQRECLLKLKDEWMRCYDQPNVSEKMSVFLESGNNEEPADHAGSTAVAKSTERAGFTEDGRLTENGRVTEKARFTGDKKDHENVMERAQCTEIQRASEISDFDGTIGIRSIDNKEVPVLKNCAVYKSDIQRKCIRGRLLRENEEHMKKARVCVGDKESEVGIKSLVTEKEYRKHISTNTLIDKRDADTHKTNFGNNLVHNVNSKAKDGELADVDFGSQAVYSSFAKRNQSRSPPVKGVDHQEFNKSDHSISNVVNSDSIQGVKKKRKIVVLCRQKAHPTSSEEFLLSALFNTKSHGKRSGASSDRFSKTCPSNHNIGNRNSTNQHTGKKFQNLEQLIEVVVDYFSMTSSLKDISIINETVMILMKVLDTELQSKEFGFDFTIFQQYYHEVTRYECADTLDRFGLYYRRSIFLSVICKYLGIQFYEMGDSIAEKVKIFKQRHINCIDNLPEPEEIIDQVFPSFMKMLAAYWTGKLRSEEIPTGTNFTNCDHENDYTMRKTNSSTSYALIQLILELVNSALISGTAHVVISTVK